MKEKLSPLFLRNTEILEMVEGIFSIHFQFNVHSVFCHKSVYKSIVLQKKVFDLRIMYFKLYELESEISIFI